MKEKSPDMEGEAVTSRQRTKSAMLVIPPDITCGLTPEEEQALAWQIVEHGDKDALNKLYCCCLEGVYNYFYRKTWADVPETENLTQETWVRAIEGLCDGSWSGNAFRPWLFGIAKYVFYEWLRKKPPFAAHNESHSVDEEEQIEQATQIDLLDDMLMMKERGTILWRLVRELPPQDRRILLLRYYHDLSYTEIAKATHSTEGACKTRSWRALNRLREKILQRGLGPELGFGKSKQQGP